jgi:two-component system, chemotaxis family, protein-glutamate methylesterase/glutaminase
MEIWKERPVRVLAADDSAVMRAMLRKLFVMHEEDRSSELPRMELCGLAQNGVECLAAVKALRPDVLVLDLEMPKLNGLDVLDSLRLESSELPVIMCSSYTEHGARSTLEALACGASDYVMKPGEQGDVAAALLSLSQRLLPRIAALAKDAGRRGDELGKAVPVREKQRSGEALHASIEVVVVGLSTGGPSALEHMLPQLPSDFPVPVLIVQHMPKMFTEALAHRLDRCCALHVEQAYDGAPLHPGMIWLAPGGSHMEVDPRKAMSGEGDRSVPVCGGRVRLHQQELLNYCRPSVDHLFHSAARMYGSGTLALVMTGMGADGLSGARAVHERGGVVLAQDRASSAVWGMPGRVAEAGIANSTLPLAMMAAEIKRRVGTGRTSASAITTHSLARQEGIHGML